MYLSKLEIFGFKSFAHKIQFQFDDGITAIIGPNGCGKSNIVDAIRWVLGEQRTTLLRLDRMENAIFSGTASRKPLSMAEVSLYIENNKNILPSIYTEVKITRRLYRSGDSEYLLNNRQVRLKDIIDLFADTGMGADAYSVIELKMVEQILSDNAEERRKLFEEASGIKKYKIRRRAALRKLDTTDQELIRLNDLIAEIQKTVNSLSRQVGKARRYHKLKDEIRLIEIHTFQLRTMRYQQNLLPLREELAQVKQTREHLGKEVNVGEAELEKLRVKEVDSEHRFREIAGSLNKADEKIRNLQQQVQLNEQRITSLKKNIERTHSEITEYQLRLKEISQQIKNISGLKSKTVKLTESKQSSYQTKANRQLDIETRLENSKQKYKLFREDNANIVVEFSRQKEAFQGILIRKNNFEEQQNKLINLKENLEESLQRKQIELSESEKELKDSEKEILLFSRESENLVDKLERWKKEEKQLLNQQNALLGSLEKVRNQKEFIEKLISSYEGFTEGVQYVMSHKSSYGGIVDILANMIDTAEEYRPAVESYLHELANYLVVDEVTTARHILEDIRQKEKGRLTVVPLSFLNARKKGKPAADFKSEDAILLDKVVRYDARYGKLFNHLFDRVLLVKNIDTALEIRQQYPEFKFLTRKGEFLGDWGTLTGGNHHFDLNLTGRKQQFHRLSKQHEKLYDEQKKNEIALKKIEEKKKQDQHKLDEFQKLIREQEELLLNKRENLNQNRFEVQNTEKRILEITGEVDSLSEQIFILRQQEEKIRPTMDEVEHKQHSFQEQEQQLNREVEETENSYRKIAAEVQQMQIEYLNQKSYLNELDQQEAYLQESLQDTRHQIERGEKSIASFLQEIEQFEEENLEYQSSLENHYQKRDDIEKEKLTVENKYQSLKSLIMAKEDELKKKNRRWNQAMERMREAELHLQELELKINAQKEQMLEKYGENFGDLVRENPVPENISLQELQEQSTEVKRKFDSLGDVNPLAVKEYEKEKERLDFLKTQEADLLEAKNELLMTIRKLNKTAHAMFMETFQKINTNFQKVFSKFFEGGKGELNLVETDDPLEANIDINVHTKGRRLSTLSLMSAGEKTLTAISLLFSIYLVKPSPFCIFDEVDAPLDDINIGRYNHAIKEFSNNTQFILVTHNKMTMQAAQAMYGITMEELGVSKVVSVKFN